MLTSQRLVLRAVRESDFPRLSELRADIRNMGDYWPLHLISEALDLKRFRDTGWWGDEHGSLIITDHANAILGQVNFYKNAGMLNALEIGYRLYQPENWGKGYTTEAVSLFVPFLFETRSIDRVQAMILSDNVGSRRVLEKCGFTLEGTLRQAVFHRGRNRDALIYSILRNEYKPLKDVLA